MFHSIKLYLIFTLPLSIIGNAYSDMAKVDGGKFLPLYGQKDKQVIIEDFYMDVKNLKGYSWERPLNLIFWFWSMIS